LAETLSGNLGCKLQRTTVENSLWVSPTLRGSAPTDAHRDALTTLLAGGAPNLTRQVDYYTLCCQGP